MVKKMNRIKEIIEDDKKRVREEKKDEKKSERDEKVEDKRQWKKEKPRPLKDLLLALASALKWFAIAAGVGALVYKLIF